MPPEPSSSNKNKRTGPLSRASAAYPRKRAVAACQVCRLRKTKCDQKKPSCSFCESIGVDCKSSTNDLSSFDPASIDIIGRLDTLQKTLDAMASAPTLLPPPPPTNATILPSSSTPTLNGVDQCSSTIPLGLPADLNPDFHERSFANFLPGNLASVLKWPAFQQFGPPPAVIGIPAASRCGSPSARSTVQGSSTSTSISDELQPAACNRWLDAFFRYDHCKNPVLNEQTTRHTARRVCEEGVGWDHDSCLVLLVCANGALALSSSSTSPLHDGRDALILPNLFFAAAIKRIGSGLGPARVVQAQCYFLAGMFLMSTLQPFDAWRMFLQSLAICQRFSHLQGPEASDGDAAAESIYWSSWKSEREVRWELSLADFAEIGLDAPRSFPTCSDSHDGDNLRAWYFYLSEISLWRLETVAKKEMKALVLQNPAHLYEALAEMAEDKIRQTAAWQDSLPSGLSIVEDDSEMDVLKFVLRGRTTYFHEMISWPFIHAALNEGVETPLIRSWAARGFAFHLDRLNINLPGFYHRHHGTWLMLQSSARSACILLLGAQVPSTIDLLPHGWQVAVEATISMLRFWDAQSDELGAIVDFLSRL